MDINLVEFLLPRHRGSHWFIKLNMWHHRLTSADIFRRVVVFKDNEPCSHFTCALNSGESGAGSPSDVTCIFGFINLQSWQKLLILGRIRQDSPLTFNPRLRNPVCLRFQHNLRYLVELSDQAWMFNLIQSFFRMELYQQIIEGWIISDSTFESLSHTDITNVIYCKVWVKHAVCIVYNFCISLLGS